MNKFLSVLLAIMLLASPVFAGNKGGGMTAAQEDRLNELDSTDTPEFASINISDNYQFPQDIGSVDEVFKVPAAGTVLEWGVGGGGGATVKYIDFPAGSWDYPDTNIAPLDTDTGTNGTIKRQLHDDTTEEFVIAQIQLPAELDATDTVYFQAYGYAVTAAASKNIELKFYHAASADLETWDESFSSVESGDLAIADTQDFIDYLSWSETVSNLDWVADDFIRIKVSRIDASADDLSGDWGLVHFRLKLPLE